MLSASNSLCFHRNKVYKTKIISYISFISTGLFIYTWQYSRYCEAAVPGSINISLSTVDLDSDNTAGTAIPASPELSVLYNNKGKIVVVAGGSNMTDSAKVSYI